MNGDAAQSKIIDSLRLSERHQNDLSLIVFDVAALVSKRSRDGVVDLSEQATDHVCLTLTSIDQDK
jgi:hypothetical protein